jgi:S1-C subfamily serine protease
MGSTRSPTVRTLSALAVIALATGCQPPQRTASERTASFAPYADRKIEGSPIRDFLEARYGYLIMAGEVTINRGQPGAEDDVYQVFRGKAGTGTGSAVAIDRRGYFLTAAHNLGLTDLPIFLLQYSAGAMQLNRARIVWQGDYLKGGPDLGILKIERELTAVAKWAPEAKIGESIFGVGPVGGPLPRKAEPLTRERGYYAGQVITREPMPGKAPWLRIEHSAPTRSGDSGGPLFNLQGELIGVQSASAYASRGIGPIRFYTGNVKSYLARPANIETIASLIDRDFAAKR